MFFLIVVHSAKPAWALVIQPGHTHTHDMLFNVVEVAMVLALNGRKVSPSVKAGIGCSRHKDRT